MDRFVKLRKIGEGSFGKALLVKSKKDGKQYVIKEINISKMSPKEREDSRKEVKVLSRLKHPNIVAYMESFEENGNLYIVMEYCEGGDLYKKINTQRGILFPEEQVMNWFVQICLAMKHVHDRKILHRDLKSQNIFLTKNGLIKLGDFGIARVLHNTMELARTCIGTPYYLSPEICENRPYNNKSDIWSLGCVLYELLTLKHAFDGGNMKNLVLKIIRGSYSPVPLRYSADVRGLVAQLFKRSPHDRPSVNSVLKKPFIQKRIQLFLSEEVMESEFSHTVLHRRPLGAPGQHQLVPRPAKPVMKPAPKISDPRAKYGVSVAKKKPAKKPGSNEAAKKPARPPSEREAARQYGDRRKELDARERRRKELAQQQDQAYQDYMKKVQQQRWEKQQREQINRAREKAWKNTLDVAFSPNDFVVLPPPYEMRECLYKLQDLCLDSSFVLDTCASIIDLLLLTQEMATVKAKKPSAPAAAAKADPIQKKEPSVMQKYQARDNGKENKPARPQSAKESHEGHRPMAANRPVSANEANRRPAVGPTPAWEAAKQGQENRALGGAAAERARVVEEFWLRKREAAANKDRGRAIYGGYDYKPQLGDHYPAQNNFPSRGNAHANRQNNEEQDYLARLEAIRRQNYQERRQIQQRMAGIRAPVEPPKPKANEKENILPGDPRYDPDARRKKIAALKAQAEERASMLRQQLEIRRKAVMQKIEDEGKLMVKEEQKKKAAEFKRPLPVESVKEERPLRRAVPSVGLDTAMKQVGLGMTKIFRSNSENDISKVDEEERTREHHERKAWDDVPFELRMSMLPLEVTASAMEETSVGDVVYKPSVGAGPARRQWGAPQKTQVVSALEKAKIMTATTTIAGGDEPDAAKNPGVPTIPEENPPKSVVPTDEKAAIGVTITIPKEQEPSPGLGVTVTKSPATPKTVILRGEPKPSTSPNLITTSTDQPKDSVTIDSKEGSLSPDQRSATVKPSAAVVGGDENIEEVSLGEDETLKKVQVPPKSPAQAWTDNSRKASPRPKSPLSPSNVKSASAREAYQQFLTSQRQEKTGEEKEEQQALFEHVNRKEEGAGGGDERDNIDIQDVSIDDMSFHTPDTSLNKTSRTVGLQSGSYDTDTSRLRTCSLPDVRLLFQTASSPGTFFQEQTTDDDQLDAGGKGEEQAEEEGEGEEEEEEDGELEDDEEDELQEIGSGEEDNDEEFAHMLESMRDVLVSSARSPSPLKNISIRSLDWDHGAEAEIPDDESSSCNSESGRSSELSNLNEDWESDEEDEGDDEEDATKKRERRRKRMEEDESLFQRLEESRMKLEQELGFNKFLKVYRYLQSVQENDDEDAEVGSSSEICELLGEKEHLYPKILYLVMADAAYSEDNQ